MGLGHFLDIGERLVNSNHRTVHTAIWVAVCAMFVSSSALAVNVRHEAGADVDAITYGASSQFDATVYLEVPSTDVTGTIIRDGSWILTAAHAVDSGVTPGQVSFTKNSVTYTGTQIFLHPNWTGSGFGSDLALVKLSSAVTGVTPATIYTDNAELTKTGSLVGFGFTGTGATGNLGGGQETLRGAQNKIDLFVTTSGSFSNTDGADRKTLFADFDAPAGFTDLESRVPPNFSGGTDAITREGTINAGDSGSPLFIEVTPNNWQLAGVGAGVLIEDNLYTPHDHDDARFSDYGDAAVWTRVSTSATFILETVPEPSSAVLAILGGLGLGILRRRSRRG
jgi:hypothetical protein